MLGRIGAHQDSRASGDAISVVVGRFGSLAGSITGQRRLSLPPQLQQVVYRAVQLPLAAHGHQTAQRELSESKHVSQPTNNRLDDPSSCWLHWSSPSRSLRLRRVAPLRHRLPSDWVGVAPEPVLNMVSIYASV